MSINSETISKLKKIYADYPDLINYRIKSGNIYQRAQASLIKEIAIGASQVPEATQQSDSQQSDSLQNNVVEGLDVV